MTLTAVGYVRMSTDDQADSPARQRGEIERYAAANGYRIVRWYEDHGLTGTESKNRPGFLQLLADAQAGKVRAVIASEISRLSREGVFKAFGHFGMLHEAGARVFTVDRGEYQLGDLSGQVSLLVDTGQARAESEKLARRVASGLRNRVENGCYIGRGVLGYDRLILDDTGNEVMRIGTRQSVKKPPKTKAVLVPSGDIDTVGAIRSAFDLADEGASFLSIAAMMNRRGCKTMLGNRFDASSIKRLLTDVRYVGIQRYGQSAKGKFATMFDDGDTLVVEDAHPALVDERLFARVQRAVSRRSYERSDSERGRYLLSGLCTCGGCGRPMFGKCVKNANTKSGIQVSYFCNPHVSRGNPDCPRTFISRDPIERMVLRLVRDHVLTEPNRRKLEQLARRNAAEQETTFEREQLDALRAKIDRATENILACSNPANVPLLEAQLDRWRHEEAKLVDACSTARAAGEAVNEALEAIAEFHELADRLDTDDPESREHVAFFLRRSIDEIVVDVERHEVDGRTFQLKGGRVTFVHGLTEAGMVEFTDADVHPERPLWRVMAAMDGDEPVSRIRIAESMGITPGGTYAPVRQAESLGLIRSVGRGKGFVAV